MEINAFWVARGERDAWPEGSPTLFLELQLFLPITPIKTIAGNWHNKHMEDLSLDSAGHPQLVMNTFRIAGCGLWQIEFAAPREYAKY